MGRSSGEGRKSGGRKERARSRYRSRNNARRGARCAFNPAITEISVEEYNGRRRYICYIRGTMPPIHMYGVV